MRKHKIAVCLMTVLLLSVLVLTELMQRENYPFTVEIYTQNSAERIACWRRNGCYYVFLPSGADPNRIYREEFRPLLLELTETGMDQYRQQIQMAVFLNEVRWEAYGDYETEEKKRLLQERIQFFDEYLGSEGDYCTISLITADYNQWRSFAVRRGETADFLISQGITWLDYETVEPFDITAPVMDDWVIYQAE